MSRECFGNKSAKWREGYTLVRLQLLRFYIYHNAQTFNVSLYRSCCIILLIILILNIFANTLKFFTPANW